MTVLTLLFLFMAKTFAATEQFQATVNAYTPATIAQVNELHFGSILPIAGATCSMDASGAISGQCDASDANISQAQISISGLFTNQAMSISIAGSANTEMSFTPTSNVTGAVSDVVGLGNGVVQNIVTAESDPDLVVTVYGDISLLENLTPGSSHTIDFTVTIDFQ